MSFGAVLPPIHAFVPAATILEIAPGYGRWTQLLKDLAEQLVIVDIAENCIEYCKERFCDATNTGYHVNDGRSLDMVEDRSVDFAFSCDLRVTVEADVLDGYLRELPSKLTKDGVPIIHHSNLGAYRAVPRLTRRIPRRVLPRVIRSGVAVDLIAWRAHSAGADLVAAQCESAGFSCISQEKISWEHGNYLIDVISVTTRRGSRSDRDRIVLMSHFFRQQGRRMAELYSAEAFPTTAGPTTST